MTRLNITLATGHYDRVLPLRLGEIEADGIALNHLLMPVENALWRMVRHQEFDASEMSLGAHVTLVGSGDSPFVAIPVFPSRFFRHSGVFVNKHAGVSSFEDLRGKTVGIPQYAMTAVIWMRGVLHNEHGVGPEEVRWIQGGLNKPGGGEKIKFAYPPGVRVDSAPADTTLSDMLERGEITALFCARAPEAFIKGSPEVVRLFPDYKEVEQAYYRKTRIFPIMHTVVIKQSLYQKHPWVARSLYDAFVRARQQTYERMRNITSALPVMLPWLMAEIEDELSFFEDDFWPYGVEANRITLDTFTRYAHQQGLTPHQVEVESLFAPNTLDVGK